MNNTRTGDSDTRMVPSHYYLAAGIELILC